MRDERPRALTVLALARDLLAEEARWVKAHHAVDRRGDRTDPCGRRAVRWCADGALMRAAAGAGRRLAPDSDAHWKLVQRVYEEAYALLEAAGARWGIPRFNDQPTTPHAAVLALFDRAIELGRGK
jgi:hypothetical protein